MSVQVHETMFGDNHRTAVIIWKDDKGVATGESTFVGSVSTPSSAIGSSWPILKGGSA